MGTARLGLFTGFGLVVANMIGAGVFLSAGYMAQDLGPGQILLAWAVGSLIALCGTHAYATLALRVPRSGGEYRLLHDLLHPFLGYFAGWVTLLAGFSAPVAANAHAAAAFTATLVPVAEPRLLAAGFVVALTLLHARRLSVSRWTQDLLVVAKIALVLAFAALGVFGGSWAWPTWTPPHAHDGFPAGPFAVGLFYIAFAFSGWNAAVYASEEFRDPRRHVTRAMTLGCASVAMFYLLVNWVFVANLTPQRAAAVFEYETARVTLGHLVANDILGPAGGRAMSVLAVFTFLSAMSAMIFAGPRVYAAMAADGFLPRALMAREGHPPTGSVWLQGVVTLLLLQWQALRDLLANVGAILTLVAALTVLGVVRLWLRPGERERPGRLALGSALVYVLAAVWMLYHGIRDSPAVLIWLGALVAVTAIAYAATRRR
jgi:APA family basic amino acid/polyamine antiporter